MEISSWLVIKTIQCFKTHMRQVQQKYLSLTKFGGKENFECKTGMFVVWILIGNWIFSVPVSCRFTRKVTSSEDFLKTTIFWSSNEVGLAFRLFDLYLSSSFIALAAFCYSLYNFVKNVHQLLFSLFIALDK